MGYEGIVFGREDVVKAGLYPGANAWKRPVRHGRRDGLASSPAPWLYARNTLLGVVCGQGILY